MNDMNLYRALQQHTGEMNKIVIALYKGQIEGSEAAKQAIEKLENTLKTVKEQN